MKTRWFLLFIGIFRFFTLNAQTGAENLKGQLGTWNILSFTKSITPAWEIFGEAQLRSLQFYDNFHYHEFKIGLTYKTKQNYSLSLTGGKYDTYGQEGNFDRPKNLSEFRVWPMVKMWQYMGNLKVEHRYRAEFRFTTDGFKNRYRYRLGMNLPLWKGIQEKELRLSGGNELFFGDQAPYFQRTRANIGLEWKFNSRIRYQLGFLHQFDYRINDETGRDFLTLGLHFSL